MARCESLVYVDESDPVPNDVHPKWAHVGEVEQAMSARLMLLGEDHVPFHAVILALRTEPPLKRAPHLGVHARRPREGRTLPQETRVPERIDFTVSRPDGKETEIRRFIELGVSRSAIASINRASRQTLASSEHESLCWVLNVHFLRECVGTLFALVLYRTGVIQNESGNIPGSILLLADTAKNNSLA